MPWPFSKKKKSKNDDLANLVIGGPKNGRAMGEPRPQQKETRVKEIPKFEFESQRARRVVFAEWAKKSGKDPGVTVPMIDADYLLSGYQDTSGRPPDLAKAKEIVQQLRSNSDPWIKQAIVESEKRWAEFGEVFTLEDNLTSQEQYVKKFGGRQQLAGLSGKVHYRLLGTYNEFTATDEYQRAFTLAPQAPSTVGRPALPDRSGEPPSGGDQGGEPPKRSRPLPPTPNRQTGPKPTPPPRPPRRDLGEGQQPPVPEPVKKVALQERQDPRATERKVLEAVKNGTLNDDLIKQLGAKIAKDQTRSRAREVTEVTESEYTEIVSHLSNEERAVLKKAVDNYTKDSSKVNAAARGHATGELKEQGDKLVDEIDQMFDIFEKKGLSDKTRITYRLATYQPDQKVPYGEAIKVGDCIMDKAFVSSSENRQLLISGSKLAKKGTRYVKFTIIGSGGANVSKGSEYNNENEKAMHEFAAKRSKGGKLGAKLSGGPHAGQAEVLYRRNSVFRVESIKVDGKDVHVVVRKVPPDEVKGQVKDSFTGASTSLK